MEHGHPGDGAAADVFFLGKMCHGLKSNWCENEELVLRDVASIKAKCD